MTTIFTKGDVKRKFLSIQSEIWSDITDLQKEIDELESKDCLIVDVKTLKSHEINDNLYLTQYVIEYLSPKYEVVNERRVGFNEYVKTTEVFDTLKDAESSNLNAAKDSKIVKRSPKELEFK